MFLRTNIAFFVFGIDILARLKPVDIKHSVKVVDFVLEYYCCETAHSVADYWNCVIQLIVFQ